MYDWFYSISFPVCGPYVPVFLHVHFSWKLDIFNIIMWQFWKSDSLLSRGLLMLPLYIVAAVWWLFRTNIVKPGFSIVWPLQCVWLAWWSARESTAISSVTEMKPPSSWLSSQLVSRVQIKLVLMVFASLCSVSVESWALGALCSDIFADFTSANCFSDLFVFDAFSVSRWHIQVWSHLCSSYLWPVLPESKDSFLPSILLKFHLLSVQIFLHPLFLILFVCSSYWKDGIEPPPSFLTEFSNFYNIFCLCFSELYSGCFPQIYLSGN